MSILILTILGSRDIFSQKILNVQSLRNTVGTYTVIDTVITIPLFNHIKNYRQKHEKKLTLPLFYQREVIYDGLVPAVEYLTK